jgi:hypothetical protein
VAPLILAVMYFGGGNFLGGGDHKTVDVNLNTPKHAERAQIAEPGSASDLDRRRQPDVQFFQLLVRDF